MVAVARRLGVVGLGMLRFSPRCAMCYIYQACAMCYACKASCWVVYAPRTQDIGRRGRGAKNRLLKRQVHAHPLRSLLRQHSLPPRPAETAILNRGPGPARKKKEVCQRRGEEEDA